MSQPSAAVAAVIKSSTTQVPQDKIDAIRSEAESARDLEMIIHELEERISQQKADLQRIYQDRLPQLMQEAGIDHLSIPPQGNQPGYHFKLKKFYRANIAAKWAEEKREAAFKYIKDMGAEDLIKTEVSVMFPKGGMQLANKLVALAKKMNVPVAIGKKKINKPVQVELIKTVSHGTLSAWLKELVERRKIIPSASDLEKIGGAIGVIVDPEERRE